MVESLTVSYIQIRLMLLLLLLERIQLLSHLVRIRAQLPERLTSGGTTFETAGAEGHRWWCIAVASRT